jgi:hypothetical protein
MWGQLRDALGLEQGHATERGVGAETTPPGEEVRSEVRSDPVPAVAIIGPGSRQADRWLPGEIGAEPPAGIITREQFDDAAEAIWSEIQYQNQLPRRTEDEAKDVPGFCTLGRRYIRKLEDDWADNPGEGSPCQVPQALHGLRKVAAVFTRAMVCNGVRVRDGFATNDEPAGSTPRGAEVRSEVRSAEAVGVEELLTAAWGVVRVGGSWVSLHGTESAAYLSKARVDVAENWLHVVERLVSRTEAERLIAAARREAGEARAECERLRLTDDERRLLYKYHRSEERAIVQFAVTSASYVADAKHATAVIGGLLARHDKGGAT